GLCAKHWQRARTARLRLNRVCGQSIRRGPQDGLTPFWEEHGMTGTTTPARKPLRLIAILISLGMAVFGAAITAAPAHAETTRTASWDGEATCFESGVLSTSASITPALMD